jgi:hypothetical protein
MADGLLDRVLRAAERAVARAAAAKDQVEAAARESDVGGAARALDRLRRDLDAVHGAYECLGVLLGNLAHRVTDLVKAVGQISGPRPE